MDTQPQPTPLRVGQLIGRMVIGVLILMAVLGFTGWLFGPQIKEMATWFVAELGLPGLFGCFFVPDAVPIPGAHEVCTGFSLIGGVPFWTVVSVASAGSMSGGMAVALYTTMAGLITSTLLRYQYHLLDTAAVDLANRVAVLVHTRTLDNPRET